MATFSATRRGAIRALEAITTGATNPVVILMTAAHDFDAAVGALTISDVVADEASPTSYARQPLAFAGAVAIDGNGRAAVTWTDTSFGVLGGAVDQAIGGAYVADFTGNDATSDLLHRIPFGTAISTDGTVFTIRWQTPTARADP